MKRDQGRSVPDESTRSSSESYSPSAASATVYDKIGALLRTRGWVKGTPRYGEALCLVAAIDEAAGVGVRSTGAEGAKLARVGRIGAHLRDLVNVRNLAAWSDESSRTLDEILELLEHAAIAFPED